jgi:hypothetical protein
MVNVYACNSGRLAALVIVLWDVLYGHAAAQMLPLDPQQQQQQQLQQQRRQELRSMVRQQQLSPVLNTAVAAPAVIPASAALASSPRRLSIEEKTELRRQLARDMRAQIQISKQDITR